MRSKFLIDCSSAVRGENPCSWQATTVVSRIVGYVVRRLLPFRNKSPPSAISLYTIEYSDMGFQLLGHEDHAHPLIDSWCLEMTSTAAQRALSILERLKIADLYYCYAEAVNDGRLDDWPKLFAEECLYQVIPRESIDRNRPVAVVRAENREMLKQRVAAIRKAMMFSPHYWHHVISGVHVVDADADLVEVRANYCVSRTIPDGRPEVFQVGRYQDRLVRCDDQFLFKEKICINDSPMVTDSLFLPL